MQFTDVHQFLHMGGYAFYVWTAYGVVFGLLFANLFHACFKQKQIKQKLQQFFKTSSR